MGSTAFSAEMKTTFACSPSRKRQPLFPNLALHLQPLHVASQLHELRGLRARERVRRALPASTSARLTHSRSAVSVRSRSLAPCPTLRSPTLQTRTTSALKSGVNCRLFCVQTFFAMDHSARIVAPSGV